jgi:hypothetical protein
VSTKKLRAIQTNTKSLRFHVGDYAWIELAQDGLPHGGTRLLGLAKGSRLVVLDLKIASDEVPGVQRYP